MKKGFTLIELLVVIAIIGLLASIVLVSMSGLQSKAKITKTLEFSQSLQRNLGAYAVGVWSFDDQTNPTKDGSGYNNNGTLMNGPTFSSDTPHSIAGTGTGRYSLSFDGVNDYVDAGDIAAAEGLTEVSVEAWIKSNQITADGIIVSKRPLDIAASWALWQDDVGYTSGRTNTVSFLVGDGSTFTKGEGSSEVVAIGKWIHIVGTWIKSPENIKIYVNGVLDQQDTLLSGVTMATNAFPVRVGVNSDTAYDFNGLIDEVRIYEKALTLGEIQKHYADGIRRTQNLATK